MRRIGLHILALTFVLLVQTGAPSKVAAEPDICISVDGTVRVASGSATCRSEADQNRAIAVGEGSLAEAGFSSPDSGNTAIAAGPGNTARAGGGGGGGDDNLAIAAGQDNTAIAESGSDLLAVAAGQDNTAIAQDGFTGRTATATGQGCEADASSSSGLLEDACHGQP